MARNYAYGHEHLPQQSGVQAGYLDAQGAVASGAVRDTAITFPKAYKAAPAVVAGLYSASEEGSFGRVGCSVHSVTTTGFTLRTFNGDTVGRNPAFNWIAVGELA